MVPGDRIRGNGRELRQKWFLLNVSKHFFSVRVTKHWHMLSGEIVESLSWEVNSRAIWMWSWAARSCWPCLSRGVGQVGLQRSHIAKYI